MDKDACDKQVKAALGDPALNAEVGEYMLKNAAGLGITEEAADSKEIAIAIAKTVREPIGSPDALALVEDGSDEEYSWLDD